MTMAGSDSAAREARVARRTRRGPWRGPARNESALELDPHLHCVAGDQTGSHCENRSATLAGLLVQFLLHRGRI